MRRVVGIVILGAVLFFGVDAIGDLTQTRPEPMPADSETRIVFDVATRRASNSEQVSAGILWGVCSQAVSRRTVEGPVRVAAGYRVILRPAVGETGRRRLTGCLEDAIIDRVLGDVVEVVTVGAKPD